MKNKYIWEFYILFISVAIDNTMTDIRRFYNHTQLYTFDQQCHIYSTSKKWVKKKSFVYIYRLLDRCGKNAYILYITANWNK